MPNRYRQPISDADRLHIVADRLGISEFDLFQMAYKAWFTEECAISRIERHFVHYLYFSEVPFWMRHLLRRLDIDIIQGTNQDQLDKTQIIANLKFLLNWVLPCRYLRKVTNNSRFGILI